MLAGLEYRKFNTLYNSVVFRSDNKNVSASDAIKRLKRGNQRFMMEQAKHPHSNLNRVHQLSHSQKPFVATLSCSDSRVSPEIIFDQGLGDIFEVKNAGNVLDKASIGSLEYAVSHLGVNLVVIMGHDDCGAVKASMNTKKNKSIYINEITHYIYPSVKQARKESFDVVHTAAEKNCVNTANKLINKSKIISNAIKNDGLKIIPAMYDVETGYVDFCNYS